MSAPAAIPHHIAIVMDGNGRWATRRYLPRVAGHRQGVESLRRCVKACSDRGVRVLTVFAFSSENWNRPPEEVSGLMELLAMALGHVPDPDLLIRTGGERRISNFLLWQAAYSELFFSDRLWPDFDEAALDEAIADYGRRERRFGQTSSQVASSGAHRIAA